MDRAVSLLPLLMLLAACGVEQSEPAPVAADARWGHLPPDPERPQQAARSSGDIAARG